MIRASLAIMATFRRSVLSTCALALMAGSAGGRACALPKDVVVTQAAQLRLDGQTATVAALSLPDLNDERSRLLVLGMRCRPIWSEVVDGLESRFELRLLGSTRLLEFVTMKVFGDGTGYAHRLLVMRGGWLRSALPPIKHTGKDGFYLGPLAHGRGDGIVTWTADPTGESESAAHPYIVEEWHWHDEHFARPSRLETTRKFLAGDSVPRANVVARDIGLPYDDQTGRDRFMNPDRVSELRFEIATRLNGGD